MFRFVVILLSSMQCVEGFLVTLKNLIFDFLHLKTDDIENLFCIKSKVLQLLDFKDWGLP